MQNFGLYIIITKPVLSYQEVAEICVANQIKMLQLREKDLPDADSLKIAKNIRAITKGTPTRFIINDRPDIAKLCDADAVHLGQDDLPIEAGKRIFGENKLYGLSTHSIEQAKAALQKKPAYIGFGPVFPTTTKTKPDSVAGIEALQTVVNFSGVPVVAIGGIFPENIEQVLQTGVRNIAMVRYFMQNKNLDAHIKEIKAMMNR